MADSSVRGGIYAIRNVINGKRYVGSAEYPARRFSQHRYALSTGTHHTAALQNAWRKYGADAFVFEMLQPVDDVRRLIEFEQQWIDQLRSVAPGGYNIRPQAESCRGIKHRPEVVEANRQRQIGKKQSAETIEKRRAVLVGRIVSDATRAKISKAHKGRKYGPQSEARRRATSEAMTGIRKTEEWCAKLAIAHATLADDQVRLARKMRAQGAGYKEISALVGASVDVVGLICRGKTYRHVT